MSNLVILTGNVGKQPEIKQTQRGSIAVISLATEKRWKDQQGVKQSKTSWHDLVVFSKLVDVVQSYVNQGDKLYIEGEIDYQTYEKDGQKRKSTRIIVNKMEMLGSSNRQSQQPSNNQQRQAPQQNYQPDFADDIPM